VQHRMAVMPFLAAVFFGQEALMISLLAGILIYQNSSWLEWGV